MAVRKIRHFPDPVLRRKAKKVPAGYASLKKLCDDMIETLQTVRGAGLAAPQIGISLRLIVIQLPEEEPFVLINPEVVKRSGERELEEGCLSIPGYWGLVKRSESVTVKARDLKGKEVRVKAADLLAQTLEHELDHLNGVLYIDHLKDGETIHKNKPPEEDGFVEDASEVSGDKGKNGVRQG